MRKATWAALAALFICGSAWAQGNLYQDSVLRPTAVIAGASVRVCTKAATGTPCSPLATIYTDEALTSPIAGSIVTADSRGHFQFYSAESCTQLQISASGFSTLTIPACSPSTSTLAATQVVTFSATPTFDTSASQYFRMTLTGNVTSPTLGGAVTGRIVYFNLCQDGTGGRTFAWPAAVLNAPTIGTAASSCTSVSLIYDGTNWRELAPTSRGSAVLDTLTVGSQNNILFVDGVKYAQTAAGIQAALDDLAAGFGSYKSGIVVLPAAGISFSTTITINSPGISLVGQGSHATRLTYTGTGEAFRINTSAFSVEQAGRVGGFRLIGNANANAVGMHVGDVVGLHLDDLVIEDFTGSSAIGLWFDNVTNWTERTLVTRLHLDNNKTSLKFTVNGGNQSFGFNRFLDFRINANDTQTAIRAEDNSLIYGSTFIGTINVADAGTVLDIAETSSWHSNLYHITGEQTSGSGGVSINVAAGASFQGSGLVWLGALAAGTVSGTLTMQTGGFDTDLAADIDRVVTTHGTLGVRGGASESAFSGTSFLFGSTRAGGSFRQGVGGNIRFDGSNWISSGDGTNNGSFAILGTINSDDIGFYVIPNTAGTNQSISDATLTSTHKKATLNSSGAFSPIAAGQDLGTSSLRWDANLRDTSVKRIKADAGTALVEGDFALSGGWGNGPATVTGVRGTDQFFEFVVTSVGTGQLANPTITVTPADGTWTTAPIWHCFRQEHANQPTVTLDLTTQTATSLVIQFNGTPVAAETFKIGCHTGGV